MPGLPAPAGGGARRGRDRRLIRPAVIVLSSTRHFLRPRERQGYVPMTSPEKHAEKTNEPAHIAPSAGIVWAYRFAADGSAAPIPNDSVDAALAEHGGGWIWVHLALADKRCRGWIAQHAPLSEMAREVLGGPDKHLRLDILGHEIVGVVPDLHQGLTQESDDLVRLRFVMTERLLITARQQPVHSVDSNRRAIESGKRFPTALRPQKPSLQAEATRI